MTALIAHLSTKKLFVICQMIALSACNQGQVGTFARIDSQPAAIDRLSNSNLSGDFPPPRLDPNLDSDLWVNVTHEDFADEPSQLAMVAKNNSQYRLEIVGCDERPYLKNKLTNIAAGYQFPLRRDYESRWKFLDPLGNGLFDSRQIERNSLVFSGAPPQDQFNCYYRVFVPAAASYLYLKLVNSIYTASSYSPAGQPALTRPQADKILATQGRSWLELISSPTMDILAGTLSYASIVKHYPNFDPVVYLQWQLEDALQSWANNLSLLLTSYRQAVVTKDLSFDYPAARDRIRQFFINGEGHENPFFRTQNLNQFVKKAVRANDDYLSRISYDSENNQFLLKYTQGLNIRTEAVGRHSWYVQGDPLPSPSGEIERLGLRNDAEVFLKLFGRGKYAGTDSRFAVELVNLERLGLKSEEIISFGAANTTVDMVTLGLSAGVTLAYIFIQYYLIQPLINGIFDQQAIGTFTTGINHLRFDDISASDATSWNQSHDQQHQIAANSKLTVVAKNSIFQYSKFSFTDPAIDSQFNLGITLATLTSPWTRYSSYDPFNDNRDPFLGCVNKNGHCTDGTPTQKATAVITMTISDNQPSAAKDLDSLYRSAIYHDAGLEQLASDRLLPAPQYSAGAHVINLANKQILRSDRIIRRDRITLRSDNFGLVPRDNPPASRFAAAAIVLNPGQALDLSVTIPAPANLSVESLFGGGLAVRYYETTLESTVAPFMLYNTTKWAADYALESAGNILIAKFSCQFPLPVGQGCPLRLNIPGRGDGRHHQGQLLLADANSRTLALPVYLNYRLISQPSEFRITQGDLGRYRLEVINAGAKRYVSIQLKGLPSGSQIVYNGCTKGLDSDAGCQFEFNFGGVVRPGKYLITISGILGDDSSSEADRSELILDITPGFSLAH